MISLSPLVPPRKHLAEWSYSTIKYHFPGQYQLPSKHGILLSGVTTPKDAPGGVQKGAQTS